MHKPRSSAKELTSGRVRTIMRATAAILMYHRVAEARLDPWGLCVRPQHFAEHLEVLQKNAYPISLQNLLGGLANGDVPARAVVVTFDDGYADNMFNAKPLLERYAMPATIFVSSGHIGQDREFMPDELEGLLMRPGELPGQLVLSMNGKGYQWELGAAALYSDAEYRTDCACPAGATPSSARFKFYSSLLDRLASLTVNQQRTALEEIRAWSGSAKEYRSDRRPLTAEELRSLAASGLVEVGAHTVTHALLPAHSADYQMNEIRSGKKDLEEIISRPVKSFAYPFGVYDRKTVKLVREAGFSSACTTSAEMVNLKSRCYELPRMTVYDSNGEEFLERLSRWFDS